MKKYEMRIFLYNIFFNVETIEIKIFVSFWMEYKSSCRELKKK